MKKFLNWFTGIFAIVFFIPSFLIIISWNAIPGDTLYPLKIGLEDVLLAATLRTPLASNISVKYTERRFSEANLLLSRKGSTLGYELLVEEAEESSVIVNEKRNQKQGEELIRKIEEYQKNIQERQLAIEKGTLKVPVGDSVAQKPPGEPTMTPTTTTKPVETPSQTQTGPPEKVEVVVTQASSNEEVVEDLKNANNKLEDIKEKIKTNLPEEAADEAKENFEEAQEKKEEGIDKGGEKGGFEELQED